MSTNGIPQKAQGECQMHGGGAGEGQDPSPHVQRLVSPQEIAAGAMVGHADTLPPPSLVSTGGQESYDFSIAHGERPKGGHEGFRSATGT